MLEAARPDAKVQPERLGAACELLPDAAEAQEAEGLPEHAGRGRELLLVPRTRTQRRDVVGNASIDGQDERERELRHRNGILSRAVRDVDAARRRVGDVDRVVAGARPDDEGQLPGVHHRSGDLGRSHDEHLCPGVGQRRRQGIVFQGGVVDDVAPGGTQAVETAPFELVGDEDFHSELTLLGYGLRLRLQPAGVRLQAPASGRSLQPPAAGPCPSVKSHG